MPHTGAIFDPKKCQLAVFKCTQSSTAAPAIAYTLFNGISLLVNAADLAIARTGAGVYTFTETGAWTANKTIVKVVSSHTAARICTVTYTSADVFQLNFFDAVTPSAADSGNFDLYIEIYD